MENGVYKCENHKGWSRYTDTLEFKELFVIEGEGNIEIVHECEECAEYEEERNFPAWMSSTSIQRRVMQLFGLMDIEENRRDWNTLFTRDMSCHPLFNGPYEPCLRQECQTCRMMRDSLLWGEDKQFLLE